MIGGAFRSCSAPRRHPTVALGDRERLPGTSECMRDPWPEVGRITEQGNKSRSSMDSDDSFD